MAERGSCGEWSPALLIVCVYLITHRTRLAPAPLHCRVLLSLLRFVTAWLAFSWLVFRSSWVWVYSNFCFNYHFSFLPIYLLLHFLFFNKSFLDWIRLIRFTVWFSLLLRLVVLFWFPRHLVLFSVVVYYFCIWLVVTFCHRGFWLVMLASVKGCFSVF